ncbi:LysR family transcriptional regulator [Leifsonia sp. NPDC056665]|uniref:LysR family transcriptional regulator n=1 Tax=Leifsonia sp. NPDC056665 TaxID=3345901 RepID=UPI00368B4BDE
MDRRALECFNTVARLGTVSAAAAALSVTQPAVSKQIARLESELAVRLFHRTPTGMTTTSAGETLLELGDDVLSRFERTEAVMRSRFHGRPSFRVACPHSTAQDVLAPFMADEDPPIVDLDIMPASEVDGVLDREADMAVSSLAPPAHRGQLAVATIPIMVQSPLDRSGPFPDYSRGDLERLRDEWIIVPRSGVQIAVLKAMAMFTGSPLVREASTGTIAQALAANGHGYALVTEPVRYNLRAVPAFANSLPVTIVLYASWDAQHYAAEDLYRTALSLRRWMKAHPPWGQVLRHHADT